MRERKIAIIGAGICGLYLSWKLGEKGYQVTVFEKEKEIGKKSCSGLYSQRIFEFLPLTSSFIENQINFALIHFPKKTIKINFSQNFFVFEREKLEKLLASFAQRAGAKFLFNSPLNSLPQGFDYIIGCDGYNSSVRKFLGLKEPKLFLGIRGFVKKESFTHWVETWPQREGGFIWRIPRGRKIEYGIMGEIEKAKDIFKSFLEKEKIQLEKTKSAIIPQGLTVSLHPRIALCGNAIGLTKPWSGGGVIWGLRACDILLESFPNLLKASKKIKRIFGREIALGKFLTQTVYFLGFSFPQFLPKEREINGDFFFWQ